MKFFHQIVLAVMAVVCFLGMAVQGAPSGYCSSCQQGGGQQQPKVQQAGGVANVPITLLSAVN